MISPMAPVRRHGRRFDGIRPAGVAALSDAGVPYAFPTPATAATARNGCSPRVLGTLSGSASRRPGTPVTGTFATHDGAT